MDNFDTEWDIKFKNEIKRICKGVKPSESLVDVIKNDFIKSDNSQNKED